MTKPRLRLFSPTFNERGADAQGDGRFGASRGSRLHAGRDYAAKPGTDIMCPVEGVVSRIGQCYSDDPTYKLIEINHPIAIIRVMYLMPSVNPGDTVRPGDTIGYLQDLTPRYPGITNHCHLDCRLTQGALCGRGEHLDDVLWIDPALFMY